MSPGAWGSHVPCDMDALRVVARSDHYLVIDRCHVLRVDAECARAATRQQVPSGLARTTTPPQQFRAAASSHSRYRSCWWLETKHPPSCCSRRPPLGQHRPCYPPTLRCLRRSSHPYFARLLGPCLRRQGMWRGRRRARRCVRRSSLRPARRPRRPCRLTPRCRQHRSLRRFRPWTLRQCETSTS